VYGTGTDRRSYIHSVAHVTVLGVKKNEYIGIFAKVMIMRKKKILARVIGI